MTPQVDRRADRMERKNAEEHQMEFMGPWGVCLMMIGLPFAIYGLYIGVQEEFCFSLVHPSWPPLPPTSSFFSWDALFVVVGWMFFQALLHVVVPGKTHMGVRTPDGHRLPYKCNALACFLITLFLVTYLCAAGVIDPLWLHKNYLQLATASIIVSTLMSVFLYWKSTWNRKTNIAALGNTGYLAYDFFMGRQLNPRLLGFDLKFFCELRPGLFGWVLINMSCAAAQYSEGGLTNSMLLVNVFQFVYVLDSAINEPAILTTMDIIQDGFGFMLCFGDLAWVPFTYTLQARYLALYRRSLPLWNLALVLAVNFLGLYIFRSANSEKNAFRSRPNDPKLSYLKTLKTASGSQLLISGWWGRARHINYLGDWLMGLAWCLLTGFGCVVPYFYAVYFAILLVHREHRDEDKCRRKYGKDWNRYCEIVPWRIVPYVY